MSHLHDHHHDAHQDHHEPSLRILAIDIGAGTQDILIYESGKPIENCAKLILPSQTQIVAARIRRVTEAGKPLHLSGRLMGGGASSSAIAAHVAAGLRVTATADAARTVHNRPERIAAAGVVIAEEAPDGAIVVELGDVDVEHLSEGLALFGVEIPERLAIAVQDHGYRPGAGNNDVRFAYLQSLLDQGGDLAGMVFHDAPDDMTRMASVAGALPGVSLMDTGAAAVLGVLGDPVVAEAVATTGALIVNFGNMHTFGALVRGRRMYGLFEHHTGGMTAALARQLIDGLQTGSIDVGRFVSEFDGHGAALSADYAEVGPFPFVAVTGPNRGIARPLGFHEAAPHGDMMLTGAFGLVEGVLLAMERDGHPTGLTLARN
jgi:uncharacterized protein (DUF1786 family)